MLFLRGQHGIPRWWCDVVLHVVLVGQRLLVESSVNCIIRGRASFPRNFLTTVQLSMVITSLLVSDSIDLKVSQSFFISTATYLIV